MLQTMQKSWKCVLQESSDSLYLGMVDEAGQEQDRGLEDILHSGQRTKDNRTDDWRTSSTQVRGQRITGQRTGGHPLIRSEDKVLKGLIPWGQRKQDTRKQKKLLEDILQTSQMFKDKYYSIYVVQYIKKVHIYLYLWYIYNYIYHI